MNVVGFEYIGGGQSIEVFNARTTRDILKCLPVETKSGLLAFPSPPFLVGPGWYGARRLSCPLAIIIKGSAKGVPVTWAWLGVEMVVRSLGFEGNSTGARTFNSGEVLRPSPMRGVPSNPAAPRVTCRVIGSRAFTRARPHLGLTAFIAACVSSCTAGLVGRTVGVGCVSRARCPHVTIVGNGYVGVITGL